MAKRTTPIVYEHQVIKDYVEFYLYTRKGDKYTCHVDLEDWGRVKEHKYKWFINVSEKRGTYIMSTIYLGIVDGKMKNKSIKLHRFIMEPYTTKKVDHRDWNTLDNRKSNLRIADQDQNLQHRNGRNSNNKSGYRNVFWSTNDNKWCVTLCKNNKRIHIGYFDDVHEAGKAAEEAREKYYGEYAGSGQGKKRVIK